MEARAVEMVTATVKVANVRISLPYDDVFCQRCLKRVGQFVGKTRCWKCGASVTT